MPALGELSDEQIVKCARETDKQAYAEVIRRYQAKLLRYTGYLLRDEALAEDCTQETLIKAYQNLKGFDTKKKFSSWIYRIAHNEAMNQIKKLKRKVVWDETRWGMEMDEKADPQEEWDKKEARQIAEGYLAKLPGKYAEPLELFFMEEKSYEEISDVMRIPMGTVATRINRGKTMLKKLCQT